MSAPQSVGMFTEMAKKMAQMSTPGWQILKKTIILLLWLFIFGMIYGSQIKPETWSVPSDKDGNDLVGYRAGLYAGTIINSTIGYGDYYPIEGSQMALVAINALATWFLFTVIF